MKLDALMQIKRGSGSPGNRDYYRAEHVGIQSFVDKNANSLESLYELTETASLDSVFLSPVGMDGC